MFADILILCLPFSFPSIYLAYKLYSKSYLGTGRDQSRKNPVSHSFTREYIFHILLLEYLVSNIFSTFFLQSSIKIWHFYSLYQVDLDILISRQNFILYSKGIFLPVSMSTSIYRLLSIHFQFDVESEFFKSSMCALIVYCSLTWKTLWTNGCLVSIIFRFQYLHFMDSLAHLILRT